MTRKLTLTLPKLYKKQNDFVFAKTRYSLCLASTKIGKTVSCMVWLLSIALQADNKNKNYLWVAPFYAQAKMAFRKVKVILSDDAEEFFKFNASELRIDLPNGSCIFFRSADNEQALYGEEYWGVVCDEATRFSEQAWFAIRSTITFSKAPCRMIANVRTRHDWFFKLCERVKAGDMADYSFHLITATDAIEAGILDSKEIEDAKLSMPIDAWNALYFCVPSDDGANPFGLKHINACIIDELSKLPTSVYGTDIAKSVDWTVIIGLDKNAHVTLIDRFQENWEITKQRIVSTTKDKPLLVDETGVGSPVVEDIKKQKHNTDGFIFSAPSKQRLMEGLVVAIQQHKIGIPNGVLYDELCQFTYEYTANGGVRYTAPPGCHDDTVMALALAYKHLTSKRPHLGIYDVDEPINNRNVEINIEHAIIDRKVLAAREEIWSTQ